ncbi:hypothetical protein [Streptomyces sp. NPDC002758]
MKIDVRIRKLLRDTRRGLAGEGISTRSAEAAVLSDLPPEGGRRG